jgi:hypothetical protein
MLSDVIPFAFTVYNDLKGVQTTLNISHKGPYTQRNSVKLTPPKDCNVIRDFKKMTHRNECFYVLYYILYISVDKSISHKGRSRFTRD